jgi:hypothetical protein
VKIHNVEQLSPEWHRLRLSIPTTSEFKRIVTPTGKLSAQATGYLHRLLAEWILGRELDEDALETKWMERGRALEPEAVASYEFETERITETVGFITSDDGLIGCSPDRLIVGEPGLLEIKCPAPQTHVGYMLRRTVDKDYWPQIMGQLYVTGREWVDIQSYHPGLPSVIIRVARDEEYIAKLADALRDFTALMVASREFLESEYGPFRHGQFADVAVGEPLNITVQEGV